jgi:hypothetical protein
VSGFIFWRIEHRKVGEAEEMNLKNNCFAILLAGLTLVGSGNAAPPTGKHKPDFTLTISTEDATVKAQRDLEISVSVEEKNITRHSIEAGRTGNPGEWYGMSVMLDGHPAPIKELYREIITPKKRDPNAHVTISGAVWTIKPGKSMTFEVPLTAYFDISAPGKYEITFTRGTNPGQPNNVDVKSNTITITVLADDPPSAQQ